MEKKIKNNKFYLLLFIVVLVCTIYFVYSFFANGSNGSIKKVKRILKEKYYDIACLNSECNELAAYQGEKTGKSKVYLYKNGEEVASYKQEYDSKSKEKKEPYSVGSSYFLYRYTNNTSKKVTNYSIATNRGKEVYKTTNALLSLTDNIVLMKAEKNDINRYAIIDNNGKELFNDIEDYYTYANNKVVSISINGEKQLLDEKGNVILSDYYVAKEVKDENNKTLYLIIKDSKNNSYNYFSVKELKKIGDSFQDYTKNSDNTLTISKRETNSIVKYKVDLDGKQSKIGKIKTQSEIVNELRKEVDSSIYNVYANAIIDENQKNIFVDNLKEKSFGIYNIDTKKYAKIYDYDKNARSIYSTIYSLSNDEESNYYYQITCSTNNCKEAKFYVYDVKNGKVTFSLNKSDLIVQNYYQYTNDYKVIKYSNVSKSEDKGKYVLLDKDNKELYKANNRIIPIGEKILLGSEANSSLVLYSVKDKKNLNTDESLGIKLSLDEASYYKYNEKKNTIIINDSGKEVLKVKLSASLINSDKLIAFIEDNTINVLNAKNGKVNKYKLAENEKMNDASGDLLPPYKGALFINNSSDNYFKVLNNKGKTIKKIKNAEIEKVYYTKDETVVIISKKETDKDNLYGLYIAK